MNNKELVESWIKRYAQRITSESAVPTKDAEEKKDDTKGLAVPADFKEAFFLERDDFGKVVHEEVLKRYEGINAITIVNYDDNNKVVIGSNPFYVVAANEVLREKYPDIRTASQADLERIVKNNILPLKGNYWEDSSLVLRTNDAPNKYLAEKLYEQFKQQALNLEEGTAYVLPLYALSLEKDENSPHKLAFKLSAPVYFKAPILMSESGLYINSDKMDEEGLPTEVYSKPVAGNRQLFTINSGLSGLCLGRYLDVDSGSGGLAYSSNFGRVVCVRGEATAPDNNAP